MDPMMADDIDLDWYIFRENLTYSAFTAVRKMLRTRMSTSTKYAHRICTCMSLNAHYR